MDQGYAFQVVTTLPEEEVDGREMIALLTTVMSESSLTLPLRGPKTKRAAPASKDKDKGRRKRAAPPTSEGEGEDVEDGSGLLDLGEEKEEEPAPVRKRGPANRPLPPASSLFSSISGLDSMAYLAFSGA